MICWECSTLSEPVREMDWCLVSSPKQTTLGYLGDRYKPWVIHTMNDFNTHNELFDALEVSVPKMLHVSAMSACTKPSVFFQCRPEEWLRDSARMLIALLSIAKADFAVQLPRGVIRNPVLLKY